MNLLAKTLSLLFVAYVLLAVYDVECLSIVKTKSTLKPSNNSSIVSNETKSQLPKVDLLKSVNSSFVKHNRTKRQMAFGGGFGLGWGAYDYNSYYGDYSPDYAYDYYDWVCTETTCQLCDILTSECCDPVSDVNCFLPDSCFNNPCLSGGTCVTTKTPAGDFRDFVCVCLPGLTGKYCQLVTDYFVGAQMMVPPIVGMGGAGVGAGAIAGPDLFGSGAGMGPGGIDPTIGSQINAASLGNSSGGQPNGLMNSAGAQQNGIINGRGLPKTHANGQTPGMETASSHSNTASPSHPAPPPPPPPPPQPPQYPPRKGVAMPKTTEYYQQPKAEPVQPKYGQLYAGYAENLSDGKYIPVTPKAAYYGKVTPKETPSKTNIKVIRPLGAKRIKCDEGKIWSAKADSCVEFALSRTLQAKQKKGTVESTKNEIETQADTKTDNLTETKTDTLTDTKTDAQTVHIAPLFVV